MSRSAALLLLLAALGLAVLVAPRSLDAPSSGSTETTAPSFSARSVAPSSARSLAPSAASTLSPSATVGALTAVPAACRSAVRGTVFADGSVAQRAGAAQQWMDAHRGQQASVVVTDDIVTDAAVRGAQGQPVRGLRVTIEDAGFRLSATAVFIGTFPIRALLVPTASNGVLRMDVRELDTDGMPGFFRGSVQDAIAGAADPTAWGIRMRVQGVATANGCAVIWGTA